MTTALEQIIDLYAAAWGEADADRRLDMLRQTLAPDATYTDPTVHAAGLEALNRHITGVLAKRPGARVVRTSAVDAHHDMARFTWHVELADGTTRPPGIDFVDVDPASCRMTRIIGFFGPLDDLA